MDTPINRYVNREAHITNIIRSICLMKNFVYLVWTLYHCPHWPYQFYLSIIFSNVHKVPKLNRSNSPPRKKKQVSNMIILSCSVQYGYFWLMIIFSLTHFDRHFIFVGEIFLLLLKSCIYFLDYLLILFIISFSAVYHTLGKSLS